MWFVASIIASPPTADAQTALPETIPIFPLEDVMLFPGMSVPLHVYEPRYKAMIADALKGNRIIGMVLLRPGYEKDYERSPSVFTVGCAGVINEVEQLPNGEYNITLGALTKYRITREEASKPYRIAHVTPIADDVSSADTKRWGNAHPSIVPYQLFHGSDRPFVVGCGTDRHYALLCTAVIKHAELADDKRFATNARRVKHRAALIAILEKMVQEIQ